MTHAPLTLPTHDPLRMSRQASLPAWAAVCIAALVLTGCGGDTPPQPAPPAPPQVSVIKVTTQAVPLEAEYIGKTISSRQVNIVSRVSGFLEQRVYQEGSQVQAGQVMFRMDPKPFEAQLQAARAALSQQEAALAVARANLARIKPLVALDAASPKDLDQSVGVEKQAAAAVESARAQVTQAELNLGYTVLATPVTGLSSDAQVAEGSYVNANTLLTFVAQVSPIWVSFSVAESELLASRARAARGEVVLPATDRYTLALRLADGSIFPEQGQINFTDAEFDSQNGTFKVRASFQNKQGRLRPGQFVTVRVSGAQAPKAVRIPQRAVMQAPKGHFVWVVGQDGKVQYRPVSVGAMLGDDWLIDQGLSAGDTVVVDGGLILRPGVPVRTTPVGAVAPAPATAGKSS